MHTGLQRFVERLRTNFWFVPSVMLLAALGLAMFMLRLDARLDPGVQAKLEWAYGGGPQGARSLLSTVAGSMITAASVTFSLASVALSLSSQQYGSRVLRNFMRDTVTQVMLGIFVATFFYSVLVVRAIRGSDYGGGFVPAISITTGIALTLLSLLSLVYFVHHVSTSIQASHIIKVIVADLSDSVTRLYPSESGEPGSGPAQEEFSRSGGTATLVLARSGYLQSVDLDRLLRSATGSNATLELQVKPGDYILAGSPVARIFGKQPLAEEAMRSMVNAFELGGERTPTQDIRFQFQQLTDVIVRALSPGINDPFTAINGIEQLAGSLLQLFRRPAVSSYRRDGEGRLRLLVSMPTPQELLDLTVGHIAIYAAGDRIVMGHLRRVLAAVEPELHESRQRAALEALRADLDRREAAEAP